MSGASHPLRRVVIPHEHGGWAFLAEPLVLGHLVAFSPAGPPIAVAAIAAFLARQPLVLWGSDRRRGARYPRTETAERAFAGLALTAAGALALAVWLARGPLLIAVGLAAPLAAAALAFDLSRRSRALAAELAATTVLGGAAAAIALAGGWALGPALGLWGVLAARAVSSVIYVRARLRLERGEPANLPGALAAQGAALAAVIGLAASGLTPWPAVAVAVLLLLRATHGLSRWRWRMTTRWIGITEIAIGLVVVAAVAIGARVQG